MWKKALLIIVLFYIFALLQNSFFAHFVFFGTTPNLVFILFFLIIFFSVQGGPSSALEIILYSITAGFFLDAFSYANIGPSIILLILIGFLAKKTQLLLKNQEDKFPLVYFTFLFLAAFMAYQVLFAGYLHFLNFSHYAMVFDLRVIAEIIYNLFFAAIGFWIFKNILKHGVSL